MKRIKKEISRYIIYLIRWQCSTPILAPVVAIFKHSSSIFGTPEDWFAAGVANLIGGLIFYWVDRFIFQSPVLNPLWEVKYKYICDECGIPAYRTYRLIQAPGYNKIKDIHPLYLCEECSIKKSNEVYNKIKNNSKVKPNDFGM